MILIIGNHIGRVYHAAGNKHLQKTRPVFAFVPEEFFLENGFQKERYLASRWPSINCSANPNGIGSHVLPDPEKPVTIPNSCPIFREFRERLEIAAVKTITTE